MNIEGRQKILASFFFILYVSMEDKHYFRQTFEDFYVKCKFQTDKSFYICHIILNYFFKFRYLNIILNLYSTRFKELLT